MFKRVICSLLAVPLLAIVVALLAVDITPPSEPESGENKRPALGSGAMFDSIASHYDIVNKVISLGSDEAWRRALVSSLELVPGKRVLDVATGTADVAIMMATWEQLSTTGQDKAATTMPPQRPKIIGVDPSSKMLDIGRQKVTSADLDGTVVLQQGDAQNLRQLYGASSFDAASIAFGIRNIPDRVAALREMGRVVKPGGAVSVLEFSEPREGILAPAARFFVNHVVPRLGALASGGAREEYAHLQRSINHFPLPEEFAEEMKAAGTLSDVAYSMIHPGGVYLYTARAT